MQPVLWLVEEGFKGRSVAASGLDDVLGRGDVSNLNFS